MLATISVWRPWYVKYQHEQRVGMAKTLDANLCMKGVNFYDMAGMYGGGLYGLETAAIFKQPYSKGKDNDRLERMCKEQGVGMDIWVYLTLRNPTREAQVVKDAIARWNPKNVFLDVEGHAKRWKANTGAFLRAFGYQRTCNVLLQSYYRPKYHPEIDWRKWFSYRGDGGYIITGNSPQAYPYSDNVVPKMEAMLHEYDAILSPIGRTDMPWYPTLAVFKEHGWQATAPVLLKQMTYLESRLGELVVGYNFFRQDFLFDQDYTDIYILIGAMDTTPQPPTPPPVTTIGVDQFVIDEVHPGMKANWGYDGPEPI